MRIASFRPPLTDLPAACGYSDLDARPHVLALGKIHGIACLTPLPHRSPGDRSRNIQVPEQLFRRPHGYRFLFFQLAPGAEEQLWVFNDSLSYRRKSSTPSRIEFAHLVSGELVPGNRLRETFAVVAFGARHRRPDRYRLLPK